LQPRRSPHRRQAALGTLDAQGQPVAMLADDVQWLDPQTNEILTLPSPQIDADAKEPRWT